MLFCKMDMMGAINRHNVKQRVKDLQFKFNLIINVELPSQSLLANGYEKFFPQGKAAQT
jgi:hypothetical protein